MTAYDEGSTVVEAAEEVARKHFASNGTFVLQVVRAVGLTQDLANFRYRRLKAVRLWFGHRDPTYLALDQEELIWLRDALDAAISATDEFIESTIIQYDEAES